jgi:integrase
LSASTSTTSPTTPKACSCAWLSRRQTRNAPGAPEIVYGVHPATCPVRTYRRWLDRAAIVTGPVFRPVDRHGNVRPTRLTPSAVATIVKRHMQPLGYDSRDFAGHSLRRGMATTAARNGAAERTIMRATGHTATETLRGYIEEAERFTDPASKYLDL